MPYKLRKAPKRDLYWVIGKDGTKHSKEPLPRERAEAQMRALYAAEVKMRGGASSFTPEMRERFRQMLTTPSNRITTPEQSQMEQQQANEDSVFKKYGMTRPRSILGSGPIPSRNVLQQIATQSYQANPSAQVSDLTLISATPTLKFYKAPDNTIVVGIRGTKPTDLRDVKADAMIAAGQLESSDRFKDDLNTLQQFQMKYPPSANDYYGVGHSLGGAILDSFLKKGLLKNGVSYNPAIQPQNLSDTSIPNDRIFAENDPLYALAKPFLAKKPEVRPQRQKKWWEKLVSAIPYAGTAYNTYQGHMLDQFAGGAKAHKSFQAQLKSIGISPSKYLKEAQAAAKSAGLPYKVLGFADDGEHKLAIPNADGKMIKFGRVGYNDFLLWRHLEASGKVPRGEAAKHQNVFQKSHSAMKGNWRKDPFSPNNLALKILW